LRNMLVYMSNMQTGSPAPDFSARTKDGKIGSLGSFKGRWVYLNFFSTQNIESMKEMPKIAELKKKYGHKVLFLSVCVDDSLTSYQKFIKANPRYDWTIWYGNDPSLKKTAKQNYSVTGSEAYFLISHLGTLALSPAPSPSQGIEYRFNIIFKIKRKENANPFR